jgi:ubiquitin carboxyl-terminal hydrolase 14
MLIASTKFSSFQNLHKRFPHFAEKSEHGIPAQQDAEECWSLILSELASAVPAIGDLFTGDFESW